jgi:hypothetical protein
MSRAAKTTYHRGAPRPREPEPAEPDVLHFLTRTLQAHFLDSEPGDMLVKLRNLKAALDQQEATLAGWPPSPSKERICQALAKAKKLVGQLVDEFGATAAPHRDPGDIEAALTR